MRLAPEWLACTVGCVALIASAAAHANDRHFPYTYESATLAQGTAELEPQVSWRYGRNTYFNAFDTRIEFEMGLLDRLQAALYVNASSVTDGSSGVRSNWSGFTGASTEFKLRLLDSVADPIGLALYLELTGGVNPYEATAAGVPDFFEFEGKVILDRRFGNVLAAANLIVEQEWLFRGPTTDAETELELSAGVGYFVAPTLMLGAELREHNVVTPEGGWETSALLLGPTIAYSSHRYWLAISALPQIAAFVGAQPGDFRTFHDHEAFNARILLGMHL